MYFSYLLFIPSTVIVIKRSKQRIPRVTAMPCQGTEDSLNKEGRKWSLRTEPDPLLISTWTPFETETIFSKNFQELPWWSSGLESALQCRGYQFNPWSRKIPHAVGQLSPCTTTTEPVCYNYWSPRALESLCVCLCVCACVHTRACVCVSVVWLFATSWTVAHQAPLSMWFLRQEFWSGLPFPGPGDFPNSRVKHLIGRRILYHCATW